MTRGGRTGVGAGVLSRGASQRTQALFLGESCLDWTGAAGVGWDALVPDMLSTSAGAFVCGDALDGWLHPKRGDSVDQEPAEWLHSARSVPDRTASARRTPAAFRRGGAALVIRSMCALSKRGSWGLLSRVPRQDQGAGRIRAWDCSKGRGAFRPAVAPPVRNGADPLACGACPTLAGPARDPDPGPGRSAARPSLRARGRLGA